MVTLLQTSSQATEGTLPFRRPCLQWQADSFANPVALTVPTWAIFPGFFQPHVANGKWANPEGPPRSPSPPARWMSMSRVMQETICWSGSASGSLGPYVAVESRAPPGLHPTRSCLYMKSLKPPGSPFTAASLTFTSQPGETRGRF